MRDEIETFKGSSLLLVEGNNLSKWFVSIVACQGSTREKRNFVTRNTSPKPKQEKKG
jgi:hypothetical protein